MRPNDVEACTNTRQLLGSIGHLRVVGGARIGPDVRPQLGKRDFAVAVDVQLSNQSAVEALPLAQCLAEVADRGARTPCKVGLVGRGERREVSAEGVHDRHITTW